MKNVLPVVAGAAALIVTGMTYADFGGIYVTSTDATNTTNANMDVAGHTTWTIWAAFDDENDSLLGLVDANISSTNGGFFQNGLAGDLAPNGGLIGAINNIAADSFVTVGAMTQPFAVGSVGLTPDFSASAFNNDSQIIGGWFAAPDDATGASLGDAGMNPFDDGLGVWLVPFMQLTIEDGGGNENGPTLYEPMSAFAAALGLDGQVTLGWSDPVDGGEPVLVNETIVFNPVPAPGAIALLGLAGLATRRRRG